MREVCGDDVGEMLELEFTCSCSQSSLGKCFDVIFFRYL